jgi:hypothetical protein
LSLARTISDRRFRAIGTGGGGASSNAQIVHSRASRALKDRGARSQFTCTSSRPFELPVPGSPLIKEIAMRLEVAFDGKRELFPCLLMVA